MKMNTTAGTGEVNGTISVYHGLTGLVYITTLDKSAGCSGKSQTVILSRDEAIDLARDLLG